MHCCIKYSLKISAFSVKSKTKILFSERGGIIGILALFESLLINDQYVLIPVSVLDGFAGIDRDY